MNANFAATGGNSFFTVDETDSDFFSDFFAAAMARQSGQRCFPSKVSDTASEMECDGRLLASIVVPAMVCSSAQCAPSVVTSAKTRQIFPMRTNTPIN